MMRLLERKRQPELERILYTIELDDGRIVRAVRLYYPEFYGNRMFRVLCDGIDNDTVRAMHALLKKAVPTDFIAPVFERRCHGSYATVTDVCYSLEQARYLAKRLWEETADKSRWTLFRIRNGDEVLEDWFTKK